VNISQFPPLQDYTAIFQQMKQYTLQRNENTADALWLLQHAPVFTQGQAGKPEHILDPGDIPIVQSDRGGQVTYHGPGQLMIYLLYDLKRLRFTISTFVQTLQNSIIELLAKYAIPAQTQCTAPGVYVEGAKICSLGIRVRKGCAYHGLSLNVNMDLSPFRRINPCGVSQLKMTQIHDFIPNINVQTVIDDVIPILLTHFRGDRDDRFT
jgi:lipoyl(octanoyl) transferase